MIDMTVIVIKASDIKAKAKVNDRVSRPRPNLFGIKAKAKD
jgi:hypothetical protein